MEKKSDGLNIAPGAAFTKPFFSSQLANGTSKLECLSLAAFCESDVKGTSPCGLYYKHIMIVNDDSRVVSK
jgi:hypothetical protein